MLGYNVHHSVSLDYGFPKVAQEAANTNLMVPKDVLLGRYLKVQNDPQSRPPQCLSQPISKVFDNSKTENSQPLQSLLEESKLILNGFKLELQHTKEEQKKPVKKIQKKPSRKALLVSSPGKKARALKRTRQGDQEDLEEVDDHSYIQAETSSVYNTPIPNKTIFFSPSGSSKKPANNLLQSTPVSILKEAQLNHQRSNKRLFKQDKPLMLSKPSKDMANESISELLDDSDHLACHADNIMRMAVDSTMLGSSFSSSFSITFANDSVLGKKKYPEFFTEENDSDRSVIEGMKSRWNAPSMNKSKATKTTINADDIQAAVSD